jgi:hypothetical protein
MTDSYVIDPKSRDHGSLLFKVSKRADKYLCKDMLYALTLTPSWGSRKSIEVRETMYSYFINMSIADYYRLKAYPLENEFIHKMVRLVESNINIPNGPHTERIFNTDRVSYPIPYHPKFNFFMIDDMRHLSHDYMKILSTTELSREELNQLFRITVWLKPSMSTLQELRDDFQLVTSNKYCTSNGIEFDRVETGDYPMTLRLSDLTKDVGLTASFVKMGVTAKGILSLIKKFFSNHLNLDVAHTVLPMSTYTDTFVTMSLEQLSLFINNPELESKPYYEHLNAVAKTLIQTDHFMEFILTGRERS